MKDQSVRRRYPAIFRFGGALFCAAALSASVAAFKPTAEFGHVGIVRDALTPITKTLSAGGSIRFSTRAINQIRDATAGVDEIFSSRGELSVPTAHCDDELLPECTQRLIDIKNAVVTAARAKNGEEARAQLGRALHTLQDFYSHSNWINLPGGGTFSSTLGRGTLPRLAVTLATCVDDFFDNVFTGAGLTSVTTGYFQATGPPAGKCAHGVVPTAGIHKDEPSRPGHAAARARAVDGTADFVNQILTTLTGDDDAIRALMDARGTLGFVIDNTGSMGSVINSVKTVVGQIVAAATTPESQPDDYLLQTFNDPTIGTTVVTTSASALLSAVNAIVVTGGGDCPELSQTGLLAAIAGARSGSKLYFFSDASAADGALAGNVVAAANAKGITINYILNASCSPVDPAYIRGAAETGGQLFFIPNITEISKLFGLIQPTLAGDLQPLLIVNRTALPTGTYSYVVPVDSTITSVTFSVSLDVQTAIRVRRPGGLEVLATDTDATVTTLTTGRIVTIKAPATGEWRLEMTGSGDLSATVSGNSTLQLAPVGFVERRGRAEHEGLFPIDGQPILGAAQLMRARFQGTVGSVRFESVRADGTTLGTLPLNAGDADAGSDEYVGSLTLPLDKFRVYARGVDAGGFQFQRAFPMLFGVQSVQVRATAPVGLQLQKGKTTAVSFEVTNVGPAGSFAITAASAARFTTTVSPTTLAIPSGGVGTVTINVTVPTSATAKTDTLTVVARSTTDTTVTNSDTIGFEVVDAKIATVTPAGGGRGQTLNLSITGESTHWAAGTSVLSFSGGGITVNSLVVNSATTATANITIAASATPGSRDVTITTGAETATLTGGFAVLIVQPPTGLYASSIVGNNVTFRWTSPTGGLPPTNFVIEGGITPGQVLATLPTGGTAPVFTVSAPSGAFYVRVHTISGSERSVASNEIRIFVNQSLAPSAPTNLLARVSGNSLAFGWRNTFAGGGIDSMLLDVTGPLTTTVTLPPGESASFPAVPAGTYTFRLRAANAFGPSAQSNSVVATVPGACSGVPQAPTEFVAFRVGNTAYTYWAPPTAGAAPESYQLIVTGGFNLTIPTTERTLSGAVPPGSYNLSVRAVNSCGTGPATSVSTVVVP